MSKLSSQGIKMMKYRIEIVVRRKSGVADPEGNTINDALRRLGHNEVSSVRVAKLFDVFVESDDAFKARDAAVKIAQEVLVNPVIENFEILDIEEIQ